jgi:transposase
MFNFYQRRIFLATQPVDMRKSYDSLSAFISQHLSADPFSGDAFLFVGKRKNRLKILLWEDSGFWLFSKRLEMGTFSLPSNFKDSKLFLTPAQFHLLLEGTVVLKSKQLTRYSRS